MSYGEHLYISVLTETFSGNRLTPTPYVSLRAAREIGAAKLV